MPAIDSTLLLDIIIKRAADAKLQVVCAWPVSGQYGPGSRVLYYVLVVACVVFRNVVWLKNACLVAALLFPAVAAIHGIVLASLHVNGAVDMDVYGAFQLCSIGILAAPVTARLSSTYFNEPGRNSIFLWTILMIAGLLSLTVEFYRSKTSDCLNDNNGQPISTDPGLFPYDSNPTCGLICSVEQGPTSPMRGGSANNIYVIPAPEKLTFGTATLLAAACCVPAILSLASMWNKILKNNWKERFGDNQNLDATISGTNGATVGKMKGVNDNITKFLSRVEVPVFSGAVLAILCFGEMNFFSHQVRYQTEPMASIGQWAPIVGTGLAAFGSLIVLLSTDRKEEHEKTETSSSTHHDSHCYHCDGHLDPDHSTGSRDDRSINGDIFEGPMQDPASLPPHTGRPPSSVRLSNELMSLHSRTTSGDGHHYKRSQTGDSGHRSIVTKTLSGIGQYLGTAAPDSFDDSDFRGGEANNYPTIPGEEFRHAGLPQIKEQYNKHPGDSTPTPGLRRQRSVAASFVSEMGDGSSHTPRATSPNPRRSSELQNIDSSELRPQTRHDTLEVPAPVHHGQTRSSPSASSMISATSRDLD